MYGPNTPIKREKFIDFINKQFPNICGLQETPIKFKDKHTESKRMEKNIMQKIAIKIYGVPVLRSYKIDSITRYSTRYKKENFIVIKKGQNIRNL